MLTPRSTLAWSAMQQRYELYTYGRMELCFSEEDALTFCVWLKTQTSFAFVGRSGRLSLPYTLEVSTLFVCMSSCVSCSSGSGRCSGRRLSRERAD